MIPLVFFHGFKVAHVLFFMGMGSSLASLSLAKMFMTDQVDAKVFGVHLGSIVLGCLAMCILCSIFFIRSIYYYQEITVQCPTGNMDAHSQIKKKN
jgi:hypothetical protein